MKEKLFIFSAPSGAGKSTIIHQLRMMVPDIGYSISHTSRPPRKNEVDGVNYHFVDKKSFKSMTEREVFVEWAEVYDDLYGTSFSSLEELTVSERDVLLDVDTQGAKNIKKHFENAILIYVLPPSLEVLEKRLFARGTDDKGVIKMRMQQKNGGS